MQHEYTLRCLICILCLTINGRSAIGQVDSANAGRRSVPEQPPWARQPREIAFQNDSQWEDNRWQRSDLGPFLAASYASSHGTTLKGLAIRVGDRQQAGVCYDTAQLNLTTGWTGAFVQFGARRFGLIDKPRLAGDVRLRLPHEAGWAFESRFRPTQEELAGPGRTRGVARLPTAWGRYRGLYPHGNRVVLEFEVSGRRVLESPWYVGTEERGAFLRAFSVAAGPQPLTVRLCGQETRAYLTGDDAVQLQATDDGITTATIPASDSHVHFRVLLAPRDAQDEQVQGWQQVAGPIGDLDSMTTRDPGRFSQTLTTRGEVSSNDAAYVIDTLTLPFDNPWNALFFTSGVDFFSNGDAALCTVHGDVWRISGIDSDLQELRWRRFATGLYQPLGLKIVNDTVHVTGRDQITRLHDRNHDGEADWYENFNNDLWVAGGGHEYVACLDTDPQGNFHTIHALTGVMRISADGSRMEQIADGFRNPNGMAVGPQGWITAAPQEGTWTPASCIALVQPGGYYGFGGPRRTDERPLGYDRPLCYMPRSLDNSSGAQVWVTSDRWGPLSGHMLHMSYGRCRLLLSSIEQIEGIAQAGLIDLPTVPDDFESGIMRGRFNPTDGQLYVTGLRGWQTRAVRDGCLQRVRFTGRPVGLPVQARTFTNGLQLTFSEPLDEDSAGDPGSWFAERWNYRWTQNYGSEDYRVSNPSQTGRDEVNVVSATLDAAGRAVFLEIPDMQPSMQLAVSWNLQTRDRRELQSTWVHTVHTTGSESFPESRIVRRRLRPLVTPEVEQRLTPGVQVRIAVSSTDAASPNDQDSFAEDFQLGRLVAFLNPATTSSLTPFLPPGPARRITIDGFLRTQLPGFHRFRVSGTTSASLEINGEGVALQAADSKASDQRVLLRKGFNRLQLSLSPDGEAPMAARLEWRGQDFDWEPIPPQFLFHDPQAAGFPKSRRLRLGRELYAKHHCHRCHQTPLPDSAETWMVEMWHTAPQLAGIGQRVTAEWLAAWLRAPHTLRNDIRMPQLFHTETEEGTAAESQTQHEIADLIAYLQSIPSPSNAASIRADASRKTTSTLDGRVLYEDLGCIACHRLTPPAESDEFERVSLHFVGAKYQPGALRRFLLIPEEFAPHRRMPDFQLTDDEAAALTTFLRQQSAGKLETPELPAGNPKAGRRTFERVGCNQCHTTGDHALPVAQLPSVFGDTSKGRQNSTDHDCVMARLPATSAGHQPRYPFSARERSALQAFLSQESPASLARSHPGETSRRLTSALRCAACHDRDGQPAHLNHVLVEEGRGLLPKPAPTLTWAGEKLWPEWTARLLGGDFLERTRPWLKTRMPAFAHSADALAAGLAHEHGVLSPTWSDHRFDETRVALGQQLTTQQALDCRQCHGIGHLQPRGDEKTKIHLGINFTHVRERLRPDYYQRFTLNPPRYEPQSNMPRLTDAVMRTKIRNVLDGDARAQFDAIWQAIQALDPTDRPLAEGLPE